MRWLPHDLGLWGFILAILALVLAVPLGIVSGILTPKFQVWWTTRSIKTTAQKLVKLAQYLADLEQEPLLTIPQTVMIEQQLRMTYSIYLVGYLLLWLLLVGVGTEPHVPGQPPHFIPRFIAATVLTWVVGCGFMAYAILPTKMYLLRVSPKERAKLEKEIESTRKKFLAFSKTK